MPKTYLNMMLARHLEPPLSMLTSATEVCPDSVWAKSDDTPPIWQHVLHSAYYLDKWMREASEPFSPPLFVSEAAVNLVAPAEPAVSRSELRGYLHRVGEGCFYLLENADEAVLVRAVTINGGIHTLTDQTLGQVRHVMYHLGCISAILARYTDEPLQWMTAAPS